MFVIYTYKNESYIITPAFENYLLESRDLTNFVREEVDHGVVYVKRTLDDDGNAVIQAKPLYF